MSGKLALALVLARELAMVFVKWSSVGVVPACWRRQFSSNRSSWLSFWMVNLEGVVVELPLFARQNLNV